MGWITLFAFLFAPLLAVVVLALDKSRELTTALLFGPYVLVLIPAFLWWRSAKKRKASQFRRVE